MALSEEFKRFSSSCTLLYFSTTGNTSLSFFVIRFCSAIGGNGTNKCLSLLADNPGIAVPTEARLLLSFCRYMK